MEQSIRVTARGEFGQLQRGLNQLQGDLKNVVGEIDKGARKGGFFDDSQIRALDVFSRRFKDTLRELDREFKKQNDVIDEMGRKMERAQGAERDAIKKTITERERELDVLRKQIMETERLYDMQTRAPRGGQPPAPTPASPSGGGGVPPVPVPRGQGGSPASGGGSPSGAGAGGLGNTRQLAQFAALSRGLQQLRKDLNGVTGTVNQGARKGGIFDEKQVRALDFFKKRFESTFDDMNQELEKQAAIWEDLYNTMKKASGEEKTALQKELSEREKVLEKMGDEIDQLEKIYQLRKREAEGFGSSSSGGGSNDDDSGGGGGGRGGGVASKATSKLLGAGKFALGLAGLTGIASMAREAYGLAYARQTNTLDLAQRMRGQNGWKGTNTEQYDRAGDVGRSDNMGYTDVETWGFLDQYTRGAGTIDTDQQKALMKFGRAYGLNTSEVASGVSSNMAIGGATKPKEFADAIAGSVAKSGMTPRILEVMTTNNTLLQQMNTTLKDGSAKTILAYQTTLDKIGMEKGMTQLTGAQGGNLIGGMGGIFTPGNDQWKWMGIRALQQYKPEKYGNGKMDLYDLESSFEDGLMNEDNIPAMSQYVKGISGGNEKLQKRIMQKWLTDGGFAATKTEAGQFYDATNGLSSFSEEQMKQMKSGSIDSGAKYDTEREDLKGQGYLDTDARFEHALEQIGRPIVDVVMTLKEGVTTAAEGIIAAMEDNETLKNILAFMEKNMMGLMMATGGAVIALNVLKVVAALGITKGLGGAGLMSFLGRLAIPAAIVAGGTYAAVKGYEAADQFIDDGGFGKKDVAKQRYAAMNGIDIKDVPDWITDPAQLDMERSSSLSGKKQDGVTYYKEDPRYFATPEGKKSLAWMEDPDQAKEDFFNGTGAYAPDPDTQPKITDEQAAGIAEWMKTHTNAGTTPVTTPTTTPTTTPANPFGTVYPWSNPNPFMKPQTTSPFPNLLNNYGLKDAGDSDIGILPKAIQRDVKSFTEDGTASFQTMEARTKSLYEESIELSKKNSKVTNQAMTDFTTEFRGFKEYVGATLSPLLTFFTNLGNQIASSFGGTNPMGGGAGDYSAAGNSGVTASMLNSKLGGKLSGMGQQFIQAGQRYGVDPAFLAAVAMHETGNGTSNAINSKNNVGGMMGKNGLMSFGSVQEGLDAMASNLQRNYISQGLTSVSEIQQKYAPVGAGNDPTGLNSNWTTGVNKFLGGFGVSGTSGNNGGASFFNGWQSRVTSRYMDNESFRSSAHGGLDIDGEQGDALQALAGGTVSFINRDPKNDTKGGNTVGIKMKDGKTYYYAHMSKINDNLKEGASVNTGDYLGDLGGDPGKPGSGSSTTGSHLHLGYMDSKGNLLNPEELMKSLNAGDSEIGRMPTTNSAVVTKSELVVTLKLDGDGAKAVNKASANQLEYLVRKIMKENERMKLQLSPSKGGY